ncbi:hypothetical protein TruAng_006249 [Truncatella angustata]|nr:hypothetical protein TruAng_006249 [Truncatella angustata]
MTTQIEVSQAQASCSGSFSTLTASSVISSLSPGWNLGIPLDAFSTEGSWNNAVVDSGTSDNVEIAGFNSIRIPGTTNEGDLPDWTMHSTWLQRVSDVIDMATDRGFYIIVNAHHDSALWADVTVSGVNLTMVEEKFYRLWYQVGVELGCKLSTVAFEPLNEPPETTSDHAAELNRLNNIFLQAINDTGGFNS